MSEIAQLCRGVAAYIWANKQWLFDGIGVVVLVGVVGWVIGLVGRLRRNSNGFADGAIDDGVKAETRTIVLPSGQKITAYSFVQEGRRIDVMEGTLSISYGAWRCKQFLPPLEKPPEEITLTREDGSFSEGLTVVEKTKDSFTVSMNNTQQAGTWRWRLRGLLLTRGR